ncbi:MAG: phytoene desaturase family protein, partial [Promethearchaeota archaeon]
MYDVIIIGAGVGGLTCAAKLASKGKKVLILEKIHHVGGTSHIFRRGNFYFPMGPLSFSFPNLVKEILDDIGINQNISFQRSNFQLITPEIDIIYSQEWINFKEALKDLYPEDRIGIEKFFLEFGKLLKAISQVNRWHPEFLLGKKRELAEEALLKLHREEYELYEK